MSKQAKQEKAIGEILVIRCLTGALIGVAASTLITVFISAIIGDGNYYPVSPDLVSACGSELKAIILQTLFDLLYGAAFGGAGLIWTLDWSLLKQTLVHLVICSGATFPIAWLMHWMTPYHGGRALLLRHLLCDLCRYLVPAGAFRKKKCGQNE